MHSGSISHKNDELRENDTTDDDEKTKTEAFALKVYLYAAPLTYIVFCLPFLSYLCSINSENNYCGSSFAFSLYNLFYDRLLIFTASLSVTIFILSLKYLNNYNLNISMTSENCIDRAIRTATIIFCFAL